MIKILLEASMWVTLLVAAEHIMGATSTSTYIKGVMLMVLASYLKHRLREQKRRERK